LLARSASSSGKQYLALPAALAIIKVAANLQIGAAATALLVNFATLNSVSQGEEHSFALPHCARKPVAALLALGTFSSKICTASTDFEHHLQCSQLPCAISSECHNVLHEFFINLVHCLSKQWISNIYAKFHIYRPFVK
jgi:hypothetical protein